MPRSFAGLFAALAVLIASGSASAQGPTVFVVDNTAQMAAKFGQKRRIDAAGSAISAIGKRLGTSASAGLWVYGSAPADRCDDARESVAVAPAGQSIPAITAAVGDIKPSAARTPVAAAIRGALKAGGEDQPTTVVVFTGSADDCNADLCGTARALQAIYSKAKVHIIGFSPSPQAVEALTCTAKALQGTFTAVKGQADLDKAVNAMVPAPPQAPKKVGAAAAPSQITLNPSVANAPADEQKPADQPAPKKPAPVELPPNVELSAQLSADTPELPSGVTFRATKIETSPTGQKRIADNPSGSGAGGRARLRLAPGPYLIEATYGLATAQKEIVAGADRTEAAVVFNAGTVAATALASPGGKPAENVVFTLLQPKPSADASEVVRSASPQALFHVNAGQYRLVVGSGITRQELPITVAPGKVTAVTLPLNLGVLEVKSVAVEGQPKLLPAWYRIFRSGPGGQRQLVGTAAGPVARVSLPAGSYVIRTEYGQTQSDTAVTINAGQIASQTVVLNAGEVVIRAQNTGQTCSVFRDGASGGTPVARGAGSEMRFVLPAAGYELRCAAPGPAATQKTFPIAIKAGDTVERSL
jgi:hypothetical protein